MKLPAHPPKWPWYFLRWFCKPDYLPDIEGDLLQYYNRRVEEVGRFKANWLFTKDVLLLFRPGMIRSFSLLQKLQPSSMDLFIQNIKVSIRNFDKYRGSFFINLLGLSSGLASVLLIFLWVQDELSVDQFHAKKDQLYQLLENVDQVGEVVTRATTAGPTSQALMEDYPEVEKAVSITWIQKYMLSVEEKSITARGLYAQVGFFDIFSWGVMEGIPDKLLTDPDQIVISLKLARSLFGDGPYIGKTIELEHEESFQVSGVFQNVPEASSLQFDFVLPFSRFWNEHEWVRSWFNLALRTYLLLKENAELTDFNKRVNNLIHEKTDGHDIHRFPFAVRFDKRYLESTYENGIQAGGSCLLYTSPSPRDRTRSRMPSSA